MKKQTIHFAHANGFPAKTYNKLFSHLNDDFEISYLERHAHNSNFPITNNWKHLKEELRISIEKRYDEPIIGMGHSFGGVLHLMLAAERSELYKSLVLLDAMVISRLSSFAIKWLRNSKLFEKHSQSMGTVMRRNHFETREEVLEHFQRKEKFAKFDKEVLQDYADHGFVEKKDGFELFIKPHIEAEIYKTIPDILPKLKGKINVPTIYIGGKNSYEAKLARLGFMKRNFPFEFTFIEGTHLFPFEAPQKTAKIINKFLHSQDYLRPIK